MFVIGGGRGVGDEEFYIVIVGGGVSGDPL